MTREPSRQEEADPVVRLAAIALFVALAFNPVVDAIDVRLRVPRAGIILAVFVALEAGVAVAGVVVVPSMVKQIQQLSHEAPHYAQNLRRNSTLRHYEDRYGITAKLASDARALPPRLGKATGPLQKVTVKAFGVVDELVTVLSLAFLLMLHGRHLRALASGLVRSRRVLLPVHCRRLVPRPGALGRELAHRDVHARHRATAFFAHVGGFRFGIFVARLMRDAASTPGAAGGPLPQRAR